MFHHFAFCALLSMIVGVQAASDCTGWAVYSGYPMLADGYHFEAVQCTLRNPSGTVGAQIPAGPRTLVTRITVTDSVCDSVTALRLQGSTNAALEATQPAVFIVVTRTAFTQGFITIAGAFAPHSRVDVTGNTFAITNANNPTNPLLGVIQLYAPTGSAPLTLHQNTTIRVDQNNLTAVYSTLNTNIFTPMDMVLKEAAGYSFSRNRVQLSCPSTSCWVLHSSRPTFDVVPFSLLSNAFVEINGNTIQGSVLDGRCFGPHWQRLDITAGTANVTFSFSDNTITWSRIYAFTMPYLNVVDGIGIVFAILRNQVTFVPPATDVGQPFLLFLSATCCALNNIVQYTTPTPPAYADRFHIRVEYNTVTVTAVLTDVTAVGLHFNAANANPYDGRVTIAHNVIVRPASAKLRLLVMANFRSTFAVSSALGPSLVVASNNTLSGSSPHAIVFESSGSVIFGGSGTVPAVLAPATAFRPFFACRNTLQTSPQTVDDVALPVGSWSTGTVGQWTTSRDVCFDTDSLTASVSGSLTASETLPSGTPTRTVAPSVSRTTPLTSTPSQPTPSASPTESAPTRSALTSVTPTPTRSARRTATKTLPGSVTPVPSLSSPPPTRSPTPQPTPSIPPSATPQLLRTPTSMQPATKTVSLPPAPTTTTQTTMAQTTPTESTLAPTREVVSTIAVPPTPSTSDATLTAPSVSATATIPTTTTTVIPATAPSPTSATEAPATTHPCDSNSVPVAASGLFSATALSTAGPRGLTVDVALPAAVLQAPTAAPAVVLRLLPPGACPANASAMDGCAATADPFWISYLLATTEPGAANLACHAASDTVLRCVLPPVPQTATAATAWLEDGAAPSAALAAFALPQSLLSCASPTTVSIQLGIWRRDTSLQQMAVVPVLAAGAAADALLLLVDPTACQSLALAALYLGGCATAADVHAARIARFLLSPAVTAGPAVVVAAHVGVVAALVALQAAAFLYRMARPSTAVITSTSTKVLVGVASVAAVLLYPGVGWGTARLASGLVSGGEIFGLVVGSTYLVAVPAGCAWVFIRRLDSAAVAAVRRDVRHATALRRLLLPAEHWPLVWRGGGPQDVAAGLMALDTEMAAEREDGNTGLAAEPKHKNAPHTFKRYVATAAAFWVRGQARFRCRLLPCVAAAVYVAWCALVVAPRPVAVGSGAAGPSRQCVGTSAAAAVVALLSAAAALVVRPHRTPLTTALSVAALLLVALAALAHALELHEAAQAWATVKGVAALLVAVLSAARTAHAGGVINWESRQ